MDLKQHWYDTGETAVLDKVCDSYFTVISVEKRDMLFARES